jgi:pimeloyl-ACP methyl ester carboxylesterase
MADLHVTLPSGTELALSNAGTPFAEHLVILCNPQEVTGFVDPDPAVTARHPVHLLVLDPVVQGDAVTVTPAEQADAIAEYIRDARQTGARTGARDMGPVGVVGWGSGALVAASLVLDHQQLLGAVALVAPDLGEEPTYDEPLPDVGEGPSTGTLDDRLARGLEDDEATAEVTGDEGGTIAQRWADGPGRSGAVLVIEPERLAADAGTSRLEWATDALVGSWDRVLTHVQHSSDDGEQRS